MNSSRPSSERPRSEPEIIPPEHIESRSGVKWTSFDQRGTHRIYVARLGPPSTHQPRRRLTGTAHRGPHWVNAVHILRAATHNAVEHAGWRGSATANQVGSDIIDHIGELDAKALHVLAVVFGVLVRVSRRD